MNAPYRVTTYPYGGDGETIPCATFEVALVAARRQAAKHPKGYVRVWNDDRADVDSDGLTLDEKEAVEEALA